MQLLTNFIKFFNCLGQCWLAKAQVILLIKIMNISFGLFAKLIIVNENLIVCHSLEFN